MCTHIESLVDNNTDAPAIWDCGDTITPSENRKLNAGNPDAWLMSLNKPAQSEQYPFNGMGRVKLQKHLVEVEEGGVTVTKNLLYQDDFYKDGPNNTRVPNTNVVFEIPYDFELAEDIEIPDGCVLKFDGGSISNGTLVSDGNFSIESSGKCLSNIKFGGKCISNFVPKLIWFIKEYPTGTMDNTIDNTSEVVECMTCGTHNVEFPTDKFIRITQTIELDYQVNILTDKRTDISRDPGASSNLAMEEEFVQPCIFSNNVVTIFHYKSNVVSRNNYYTFPLVIGNINIFVNVPYSELTQASTKTPIIKINTAVNRSQKGIDINCNIRSKLYQVTVPVADRVDPSVTTHAGYNYTAIDIYAENYGLSDINIRGNINGVFCAARITKNEEAPDAWITYVNSYGFYESCYGIITTSNLFVGGKHSAAIRIPTALREYEGFFVGSSVAIHQEVSDINNKSDDTITWYTASSEGQVYNHISSCLKIYAANNSNTGLANFDILDKAFGDYVKINNTFAGGRDIRHLSNLLLDGIGVKRYVKQLSYKIKLNGESDLTESLNTDRIVNSDNLFNDGIEWFQAPSFTDISKTAFTATVWKEVEVSFIVTGNSDRFRFNDYSYLLLGYFAFSDNGSTCSVEVSTSNSENGIYTPAFSISPESTKGHLGHLKIPLYDKQLYEAGVKTFVKFVIHFSTSGSYQLPYISIPSPYVVESPAFYPTASLPKISQYRKGIRKLNTSIGKDVTWDGNKWIESDGATAGALRRGTFRFLPTTGIYQGFTYFCTDKQTTEGGTDGIPLFFNGSDAWVDALGRIRAWVITNVLTNISSSGNLVAEPTERYRTILTADSGYTLPTSITVVMGSTTLTVGTDYTYDPSTGEIKIVGGGVIAPITITASGVANS
jgi:hypothetical protein